MAPIFGVTIGIVLTEVSNKHEINDLPLQVMQGIATGTVIYVVFFEVFPKGKEVGGTGFQHVLAMTLGFLAFLPSLLLRKYSTLSALCVICELFYLIKVVSICVNYYYAF